VSDNVGIGLGVQDIQEVKRAAAVDWITATTPKDEAGLQWFERLQLEAKISKQIPYEWANKWYNGSRIDNIFWGYSKTNGYIFIATQDAADKLARMATTSAKNITRLDLQVTILLSKPSIDIVKKSYEHVADYLSGRRSYSMIMSSKGGRTLYVGSRSSDQYGRLYDKGVESGWFPARTCWRYEVELKTPRALPMAQELAQRTDLKTLRLDMQTYIHQWFKNRGVSPIFSPSSRGLVVEIARRVTTNEKKLTWLRTQVRPTIHKLTQAGLERHVWESLGLVVQNDMGDDLIAPESHTRGRQVCNECGTIFPPSAVNWSYCPFCQAKLQT